MDQMRAAILELKEQIERQNNEIQLLKSIKSSRPKPALAEVLRA
jgi:hypothetical protein